MEQFELDLPKLQQLQDSFSLAAGVFTFCVDENGKKLTRLSGDKDEARKIMATFSNDKLAEMLGRVMMSRAEEQIVEKTEDAGVRVACVSVKVDSKPVVNYIVYGVVERNSQYKTYTSESAFLQSLKLLRMGSAAVLQERYKSVGAHLQSMASRDKEEVLERALARSRAMTEILQYFESDESIERITGRVLEIAVKASDISNAFIIVSSEAEETELLGEYTSPDAEPVFDAMGRVVVPDFAKQVSRTIAASSDSRVTRQMRDAMYKYGVEALVMTPVYIQNTNAMTICFLEKRRIRSFLKDEIQFLVEIARILQEIITRRIQKNSLEDSYAALEHILNSIDSGVLVKAADDGSVLFMNEVFRNQALSGREPFIDRLNEACMENSDGNDIEIKENGVNYCCRLAEMKWVNGRQAILITIREK